MKSFVSLFVVLTISLIVYGELNKFQPINITLHPPRIPESRVERFKRLSGVYVVPYSLIQLIYQYETSSGRNIKPRLEKHVMNWLWNHNDKKFRAAVRSFAKTEDDLKILASSHGALQVMGYHALVYGIDPRKLMTDEAVQDELGIVLLSNAWHKGKKKDIYERVKYTGTKYNGSSKYGLRLLKDYKEGVVYG